MKSAKSHVTWVAWPFEILPALPGKASLPWDTSMYTRGYSLRSGIVPLVILRETIINKSC